MSDAIPPYKKPEVWIAAANAMIVAVLTAAVLTPEDPGPHLHLPGWVYALLVAVAAGLQVFSVHYSQKLRAAPAEGPPDLPGTVAARVLAVLRDLDPKHLLQAVFALAPQDQVRIGTVTRMLSGAVDTAPAGGHDPPPSKGGTP